MKFEKSTFLLHSVILSHVLVAVSMKCNGLERLCLKSGLDEASEGAPADIGSDRSNLAAGISDNFVHSNLDSKRSITDVRRDRDLPPKKRLFYRNAYAPTFDGIPKPNFDLISDKPTSSTTNPINSVVRCSNSAKDSPLHGLGDEKSGRNHDTIISVEKTEWDKIFGKRRTTRRDRDRDLPPKKRLFYRNSYTSTTDGSNASGNIVQTFDLIRDKPHRKENIWNLGVTKSEPINESGPQSLDLSSQYVATRQSHHSVQQRSRMTIKKPRANDFDNLETLLNGESLGPSRRKSKKKGGTESSNRKKSIVNALRYLLHADLHEEQSFELDEHEKHLAVKARQVLQNYLRENAKSAIDLFAIKEWTSVMIPSQGPCFYPSNLRGIVSLINDGKWLNKESSYKPISYTRDAICYRRRTAVSSLSDLLELDPSAAETSTLNALERVKGELGEIAKACGEMDNAKFSKEIMQKWVLTKLPVPGRREIWA